MKDCVEFIDPDINIHLVGEEFLSQHKIKLGKVYKIVDTIIIDCFITPPKAIEYIKLNFKIDNGDIVWK